MNNGFLAFGSVILRSKFHACDFISYKHFLAFDILRNLFFASDCVILRRDFLALDVFFRNEFHTSDGVILQNVLHYRYDI